MNTCKVNGCDNVLLSKGFCNKHYKRNAKYGDPLFTKKGRDQERHGMKGTIEYISWKNMKSRCYNTKNKSYKDYGGRGIIVCDRWKDSFINFFEDMGLKPFPKAQLDREKNDGNYELDNCSWVTQLVNMRHTSRTKMSMKKARDMRHIYKTLKISQYKLAEMFKLSQANVNDIILNKIWKES